MEKKWKINRLKDHGGDARLMLIFLVVYLNLSLCWCLNEEGLALLRLRDRIENDPFGALRGWHEYDGVIDPCSWYGIECSDGKVISLNLNHLCLEGTLAPEIGNLPHIKSIILRNNTFSGAIPEEIAELKELRMLDLGYNSFSGPLPLKLRDNHCLAIILLDNNELLTSLSPKVDESLLSAWQEGLSCKKRVTAENLGQVGAWSSVKERLLAVAASVTPSIPSNGTEPISPPPGKGDSPTVSSPAPTSAPTSAPPSLSPPPKTSSETPPPATSNPTNGPKGRGKWIIAAAVGGFGLLFFIIIGTCLYRWNKVKLIKPWSTGLSGQLQKALVAGDMTPTRIAGVPNLKRSELVIACEDFSNVVGTSSIGTIYKGILSSGAEIAVASLSVKFASDWSTNLEAQFRKKIETMSLVNHRNFVNLVGYCQEEQPFTRMMVFEYAPNGTLFEHLHVKEAEHLDWGMRLRITMGMAYCLEHMHQLNPPILHKNLTSLAVTLTEDYAAKISDFNFWNQVTASEIESTGIELVESSYGVPERNVYSFGVVLFEIITARIPNSIDDGLIEDWASGFVKGDRPLAEMVDPTLGSFDSDQVEKISEIIRSCTHPNPRHRPSMREVSSRLRAITRIPPVAAVPKISPLWWAELEVLSNRGD
ncbi:hypothetical protein SAY87_018557 [Trapa incisa]|uniref:Protein kinase domain-containing protein n=1 Tax=Trapa incisa TaxID=236973 RepID=A0AAN7QWA1_9MYRT|nr:hypothetical protein SAY87_018557 [Trapa incisa]